MTQLKSFSPVQQKESGTDPRSPCELSWKKLEFEPGSPRCYSDTLNHTTLAPQGVPQRRYLALYHSDPWIRGTLPSDTRKHYSPFSSLSILKEKFWSHGTQHSPKPKTTTTGTEGMCLKTNKRLSVSFQRLRVSSASHASRTDAPLYPGGDDRLGQTEPFRRGRKKIYTHGCPLLCLRALVGKEAGLTQIGFPTDGKGETPPGPMMQKESD